MTSDLLVWVANLLKSKCVVINVTAFNMKIIEISIDLFIIFSSMKHSIIPLKIVKITEN